jgi:hypothetical protein
MEGLDEAICCERILAGTTGLEPAASAVTGQRSNQLNYVPQLAKINEMRNSLHLATVLPHKSPTETILNATPAQTLRAISTQTS